MWVVSGTALTNGTWQVMRSKFQGPGLKRQTALTSSLRRFTLGKKGDQRDGETKCEDLRPTKEKDPNKCSLQPDLLKP